MIRIGLHTQEFVVKKEQAALKAVWAFAARELDIESTLEALHEYTRITLWTEKSDDESLDRNAQKLIDIYRMTLRDRPWEKCDCRVCREIGVDAIIFRSSNRNKRRGIHNLHIFNNYVKSVLARQQ